MISIYAATGLALVGTTVGCCVVFCVGGRWWLRREDTKDTAERAEAAEEEERNAALLRA